MFLLNWLLFLFAVGNIRAECRIHAEGHDYFNISDLGIAAAYNQASAVDIFIANGCDVNYNGTFLHVEKNATPDDDHYYRGFYHYGYKSGRYGYSGHDNLATVEMVGGYTALHIALTEGNKEVAVKLLAVPGVDIGMETAWGETLLLKASSMGFTNIMEELLHAGADINHQDIHGNTPLHSACSYAQVEAVKLLVGNGSDIGLKTNNKETALWNAASSGATEIMEILVDAGADINQKNSDGETPLHAACKAGHFSAANILVTRGANLKTKTRGGDTPLLAAIASGDIKIIEMLIKAGADVNNGFPLHRALDTGDLDTARILINVGADVNIRHMQGPTPLHLATLVNPYSGHSVEDYLDILNLLLENGADASLKDDRGRTALDFAIYSAGAYPRGGKEIVKMLVFAEFQQE